jgi:hypothetical protein
VPIVFLPDGEYGFEVAGLAEGQYCLVLSRVLNGRRTTFVATDIATKRGAVHTYDIDWEAIALGKEGVAVAVDQDGDGEPEGTLSSGAELNGLAVLSPAAPVARERASPVPLVAIAGFVFVGGVVVAVLILRLRRMVH